VGEHPIKVLWDRVQRCTTDESAALGAEVPSEVAAAIAAAPLYPPATEEWSAVVNAVHLLYLVRTVKGPQWDTDSVHLTSDELVLSTFTALARLASPDLHDGEAWERFAALERITLSNEFVDMLRRVADVRARDRIDAWATAFALAEFILPHVDDDRLRVLLLRGAAIDRARTGAYLGEEGNLRIAVAHLRTARDLLPENDPEREEIHGDLGLPMWQLARRTEDLVDVEQVVEICRHRQRSGTLDEVHALILAKALKLWTSLTRDPAHIDECVELFQQALRVGADEDEVLDTIFDLGKAYLVKFQCTGDLDALKTAVAAQQHAIRQKGSFGSGHEWMLRQLADTLHLAGIHLHGGFFDEEIGTRRGLADLADGCGDDRAAAAFALASALAARHDDGRPDPEAVPWCVLAASWAEPDDPLREDVAALLDRLTARPRTLRSAVLGKVSPALAFVRDTRAAATATERFDVSEDLAELDLAISLWQRLVATGPSVTVSASLEWLAVTYQRYYAASGDLVHLRAEIAARRASLHLLPEGPRRDELRSRQADALHRRYDVTKVPPNQVEFGPDAGAFAMWQCGMLAGMEAVRSRNFEMAWYAVDLLELARSREPDAVSQSSRKIEASLRHLLWKDTRRTADLRLAIWLYQQLADEQESAGEVEPDLLNALGTAHYEAVAADIRDGDLDKALTVLRRAHTMEVDDVNLRAAISLNLGNALGGLYDRDKDLSVLDEAIDLGRAAVALAPADSPQAGQMREMLDDALRVRARHMGEEMSVESVVDTVIRGLKEAQLDALSALPNSGEARRRLEYRWWIADGDEGIAVAESLFDTISSVMWLISPNDRLERIARLQNAASDAAALFLTAGMAEQAVEILEHGRNLQWSQQLRAKEEIAELRDYRPDLADELAAVLAAHRPGFDISLPRSSHDHSSASRWEDAVEETRRIEGFEHFLDALPYDVLCQAGDEGPVVIVNLSSLRSDAIIVDRDELAVVELPVDADECSKKITSLVGAIDLLEFLGPERDDLWNEANDEVRELADLLSNDIAGPALRRLGLDRDDQEPPRLWWCPTGMLTFAPLHLAADDRVVSSYTQSLRSLLLARASRHDKPVRLVLASVPGSAGQRTTLRGVEAEVAIVSGAITPHLHLHGPAATTTEVQAALGEYTWFHFAGHGGLPAITVIDGQHVRLSTDSGGLLLHDGELEPKDIVRHDLHHVELVVVSACKSAASDVFRFNESLHPSGALQAAGCQQVVASLWAVSDFVVPDFARVLYDTLTEAGEPDARRGAHAVRDATARLRDTYPDDPLLWFSFVHIGI
jgi:tetratricopeptide (TPR) repeat protein